MHTQRAYGLAGAPSSAAAAVCPPTETWGPQLRLQYYSTHAEHWRLSLAAMGLSEQVYVLVCVHTHLICLVGVHTHTHAHARAQDADKTDVKRFLNRLLGLPVNAQNSLFGFYTDAVAYRVALARQDGKFSEGMADISASNIRLKHPLEVLASNAEEPGMGLFFFLNRIPSNSRTVQRCRLSVADMGVLAEEEDTHTS